MRGRRFADRYELRELLGRGGMAEVWCAWDSRLERAVAVKILDQVALADPGGVERFRREALAVARIAHPNIVAGYDFGTEDERPYLVMELVTGRTLADRLADGPLPVSDVVRIGTQTCAALEAAHRAGVVHRDIKPANLIMTADGTVKILDFGIARLQDVANQAALTRTQIVVGTSHFMAPEQAAGGTSDARTDLYALGCVLYALLTGHPPFAGDNPMSVLYQHLHNTPRLVRESRPEVPATLDDLVMRLLAKNPETRPTSAAAVRTALDGAPDAVYVPPEPDSGGGTPPNGHPAPPGASMPPPARAAARPLAGRAAVPPPAPPGTGVMPAAVPGPESRLRWTLGLAAAVVVAVILVAFAVLTLWPDGNPSATSSPSSAPPSRTSPPTSPSPSDPEPTATDPAGRLGELRGVLADLQAAGEVDPEAADRLDEDLDEMTEEIRDGSFDRAARRVDEFREELDEQSEEGRISEHAYQKLSESADRLQEALEQAASDEGAGNNRGPGNGNGNGNRRGPGNGNRRGKDGDRSND